MSKKLIIAISALALAILAGAIAVVGVLAAQQQKVANTFTITYTANNVSADIVSQYGNYETGFSKYLVGADDGDPGPRGVCFFTPSDESQTKSFTASDIELTASSKYVVLSFAFANTNTTGGKSMTVTIEDTSEKSNVNVYYAIGFPTTYSECTYTYAETTAPPYQYTVEPQSSLPFNVLIEIDDDTLPASYVTTAEKGLKFTLNAVE